MSNKAFIYIVSTVCISAIPLLVALMMYDRTVNVPKLVSWANKCVESGGSPSRYQVMHGKTTDTEYLCIKKDAIVDIQP